MSFEEVFDSTDKKPMGVQGDRSTGATLVELATNIAATTPAQILKTVAAAGTPVALAASGTFITMTLIANKDQARTANIGNVYLGLSGAAGTQPIILTPGKIYEIIAPVGQAYNLADWFIDAANNGDGVVAIYS